MILPADKTFEKRTIKLLPQEKEGSYKFSGRFVATRCAIAKFGDAVIITCHIILQKQVKQKGGLDYLQVFEIDGQKLWFIDDVSHVTALLPSDY
jgi:hypothetical protein